jgi:hypothetical protein
MGYSISFHHLILAYINWLYVYKLVLFSYIMWYIVPNYCVDGFVFFIRAYAIASAFVTFRVPTMYLSIN